MPDRNLDPIEQWPHLKQLMRRFTTKHRVGTDDIETEEQQRKREAKRRGVEAQYRNGMQGQGYKNALDAVRNRQEKYHDYEQMSEDAAISGALDIYADEATQADTMERHVITVDGEDEKVKEELEKFLHQILRIDDDAWDIVRRLCANGDVFYEIKFRKDFRGIYGIHRIDHKRIERLEDDSKLIGFKLRSTMYDPKRLSKTTGWGTSAAMIGKEKAEDVSFSPFRVVHFRLPDNSDSVYGRAILEPARRTWRQVRLMEDSIVIYRISRGAERRVFYINVGNLADDEAEGYIKNLIAKFKKKPFINARTGEIDERANPLAWDEDFFIPIQDNKDNTRVEQLPGGQNMSEIEDLKWFRSKIDSELKIPTSYMARDGQYDAKAGLSQQDIRFSRTIERVQRAFLEGLNKLCYIHLMMRNFTFSQITSFTLKMTPPSALAELLRLDALSAKLEIAATAKGSELLPDIWILTEVLGFSDDEANELLQIMAEQKQQAMQAEAAAQAMAAPGGGMPGGGGAPIPGAEGDLAGGEAGAAGGEQGQQIDPGTGQPIVPPPQQQPGGIELAGVRDRRKPLVEGQYRPITEFYRRAVGTWIKRRRDGAAARKPKLRQTAFEHALDDGDFGGLDIKVGKQNPQDLKSVLTESLKSVDKLITETERKVAAEKSRLIAERT